MCVCACAEAKAVAPHPALKRILRLQIDLCVAETDKLCWDAVPRLPEAAPNTDQVNGRMPIIKLDLLRMPLLGIDVRV